MKRTPTSERRAERRARCAFALGLVLGLPLFLATPRAAAGPRPEAEVLFQDGLRLLDAGKPEAACPKLEESQRLEPAPGTQFYLAECYAAVGRTASAWFLFVDVADSSLASRKFEQEKKARARVAALEPTLSRLAIVVPDAVAALPGLKIERDGVPIGKATWGTPIPVDPGPHTVRATAANKLPWEATGRVTGPQTTVTVQIGPLADLPPDLPRAQPKIAPAAFGPPIVEPDRPAPSVAGQRLGAGVLGGVGLAGLAVGGAFGALALGKNSDWKRETAEHCNAARDCEAGEIEPIQALQSERDRFGIISTVGLVVGGAASLGAVILWVTVPRAKGEPKAGVRLLPAFDHGPGGTLEGRF